MKYDKIAFTKHAQERIELRKITREMVIQTIQDPNSQYTEPNGNIKFIRKVSGCKIHAVCKPLPEENKWLVVSVWVRGEDDNTNISKPKEALSIQFIVLSTFIVIFAVFAIYFIWSLIN